MLQPGFFFFFFLVQERPEKGFLCLAGDRVKHSGFRVLGYWGFKSRKIGEPWEETFLEDREEKSAWEAGRRAPGEGPARGAAEGAREGL